MRVVRYQDQDALTGVGMLRGERVVDFTRALTVYYFAQGSLPHFPYSLELLQPADFSVLDLIAGGYFRAELFAEVLRFAEEHELIEELVVDEPRLLSPIPRPPRIIALGLNYAAHAAEGGRKPPKEPIFFVKASTAVIGPDDPVECPRGVGRIDHEVELAVIIGKPGRRISRAQAKQHIAGYTILNDVTARDMQRRDMAASNPWFLSKSFDTFCPMGPCITLPDEIQEPCELDLSLRVNGQTRQSSNTRDLIFKVPELIHRLSRHLTLEPGDIISTGTPAGISAIQPGDVMQAEVERIGVLRNPVVAGK